MGQWKSTGLGKSREGWLEEGRSTSPRQDKKEGGEWERKPALSQTLGDAKLREDLRAATALQPAPSLPLQESTVTFCSNKSCRHCLESS